MNVGGGPDAHLIASPRPSWAMLRVRTLLFCDLTALSWAGAFVARRDGASVVGIWGGHIDEGQRASHTPHCFTVPFAAVLCIRARREAIRVSCHGLLCLFCLPP